MIRYTPRCSRIHVQLRSFAHRHICIGVNNTTACANKRSINMSPTKIYTNEPVQTVHKDTLFYSMYIIGCTRHGVKYTEMYLNTNTLDGFKYNYKYF